MLAKHFETQQEEKAYAGSQWRDYGLVFCTTIGTPLNQSNIRKRVYLPLVEASGVPVQRFHDARDNSASLRVERGVSIARISELLGHSRTSTTWDRYMRRLRGTARRDVMTLEELTGRKLDEG